MPKYSMTPIENGTRLRTDHNTFASVIASYNRGQVVVGDEVWEALLDGEQVMKGDKWLRVTSVDGKPVNGWMAYIHKGMRFAISSRLLNQPLPRNSLKRLCLFILTANALNIHLVAPFIGSVD